MRDNILNNNYTFRPHFCFEFRTSKTFHIEFDRNATYKPHLSKFAKIHASLSTMLFFTNMQIGACQFTICFETGLLYYTHDSETLTV